MIALPHLVALIPLLKLMRLGVLLRGNGGHRQRGPLILVGDPPGDGGGPICVDSISGWPIRSGEQAA